VFDVIEIENRNAVAFEAFSGRFRTGHGAAISRLQRGEGINEKIGG
jgi:hypothetical protein